MSIFAPHISRVTPPVTPPWVFEEENKFRFRNLWMIFKSNCWIYSFDITWSFCDWGAFCLTHGIPKVTHWFPPPFVSPRLKIKPRRIFVEKYSQKKGPTMALPFVETNTKNNTGNIGLRTEWKQWVEITESNDLRDESCSWFWKVLKLTKICNSWKSKRYVLMILRNDLATQIQKVKVLSLLQQFVFGWKVAHTHGSQNGDYNSWHLDVALMIFQHFFWWPHLGKCSHG